nr:Vms1/Ankzf1 family peptidyl-tRNA hydrolase [uncultured Microbacterium sp.]
MSDSPRGTSTIDTQLSEILQSPGPWTTVYVDGTGDLPQVEEESRRQSVRERLVDDAGAPEEDAAAAEAALAQPNGLPSPSARIVLVQAGEVKLDRSFAGARLGAELIEYGAVPSFVPLLRHASAATRYIVVETSRDGADIRLETSGRGFSDAVTSVEGDTDSLKKVQAGGWAHARYHRYSENVWKHNQKDVATELSTLIREQQPAFVALAGDVRARQLLGEALTDTERELLIEVDANTRADGADSGELDEAIDRAIDERQRQAISDVRDRAATDSGSGGADGVTAVVDALQQARVDTLVLDNRMLDDDSPLLALDGPPWLASDVSERLNTNVLGSIRVADALARAAVLTDARVLIEEDEPLAADEPEQQRPVREPVAALRWADDANADVDQY